MLATKLPKIFVGFANADTNATYLKRLNQEKAEIIDNIQRAAEKQFCDPAIEKYPLTNKDIFEVFTNPQNQDQITVFHFGGHANSQQLFTANEQGAYAEGLIPFLATQKNLQLVFFNGCSTQNHALQALEAGVPTVIATLRPINDEQASLFSATFYQQLAQNKTIQQAFDTAKNLTIATYGSDYKKMYDTNKSTTNRSFGNDNDTTNPASTKTFPWKLYGSNSQKQWQLSTAFNQNFTNLQTYFKSLYFQFTTLKILGIYANTTEDSALYKQCTPYTELLKNMGVTYTSFEYNNPGADDDTEMLPTTTKKQLKTAIDEANVVILFLSTDFVLNFCISNDNNSTYNYLLEKTKKLDTLKTIAILLRDTDTQAAENLDKIPTFPLNKRALNDIHWKDDLNRALSECLKEIIGYTKIPVVKTGKFEYTKTQALDLLKTKDLLNTEKAIDLINPYLLKDTGYVKVRRTFKTLQQKYEIQNPEHLQKLNEIINLLLPYVTAAIDTTATTTLTSTPTA